MILLRRYTQKSTSFQLSSIGNKVLHALGKSLFFITSKIFNPSESETNELVIVVPNSEQERIVEIQHRCGFYVPHVKIEVLKVGSFKDIPPRLMFSSIPLLPLGGFSQLPWICRYRSGIFNVDYLHNPSDGWEWHRLLNYTLKSDDSYLLASKERFAKRIEDLRSQQLDKCYVFGTGPSLEKAIAQDWSDGYRIVCNTIVRDADLWHHINPHFIVAGDAIYHFGHTRFAKAFRKDLAERLASSNTLFIYPALFHQFILREFGHLADQLVPIPVGTHQKIHVDLLNDFSLPGLGNVLSLLLLPVGCTSSKNIHLFGFDGRAPNDKLFWSNSNKHTYLELMEDLQIAHPRFFDHYLPKQDPLNYVKSVHGDLLDQKMKDAESEGWEFVMLHESWTPTLQKRYRPVQLQNT